MNPYFNGKESEGTEALSPRKGHEHLQGLWSATGCEELRLLILVRANHGALVVDHGAQPTSDRELALITRVGKEDLILAAVICFLAVSVRQYLNLRALRDRR